MDFPVPWTWAGMWHLAAIAAQASIVALIVAVALLACYFAVVGPLYYDPERVRRYEKAIKEYEDEEEEKAWRLAVKNALEKIARNSNPT